jgi:hypothetical protein
MMSSITSTDRIETQDQGLKVPERPDPATLALELLKSERLSAEQVREIEEVLATYKTEGTEKQPSERRKGGRPPGKLFTRTNVTLRKEQLQEFGTSKENLSQAIRESLDIRSYLLGTGKYELMLGLLKVHQGKTKLKTEGVQINETFSVTLTA